MTAEGKENTKKVKEGTVWVLKTPKKPQFLYNRKGMHEIGGSQSIPPSNIDWKEFEAYAQQKQPPLTERDKESLYIATGRKVDEIVGANQQTEGVDMDAVVHWAYLKGLSEWDADTDAIPTFQDYLTKTKNQ